MGSTPIASTNLRQGYGWQAIFSMDGQNKIWIEKIVGCPAKLAESDDPDKRSLGWQIIHIKLWTEKMSKTIMEKIYSLFLNEMSLFEDSSYFAHQNSKSISDCGDLTEAGFRIFLRQVIGERFHITHGYIFSSFKKRLSKQIDIIITDKLVTHSLKKFEYLNGMEIVPVEAIVGIFEVKRTLDNDSYKKAIEHLTEIINDVPINRSYAVSESSVLD